jgi:hypothetical protein
MKRSKAEVKLNFAGRFSKLGDRVLFPSIVQFLDLQSNARFLSCCRRFNAARTRGDAWTRSWDDQWLGDGQRFEWMMTKLEPRWSPASLTINASNWFSKYPDSKSNQQRRLDLLYQAPMGGSECPTQWAPT